MVYYRRLANRYKKRRVKFGRYTPLRKGINRRARTSRRNRYTKSINTGLRKLPWSVGQIIKGYAGVRRYNKKYTPVPIRKTQALYRATTARKAYLRKLGEKRAFNMSKKFQHIRKTGGLKGGSKKTKLKLKLSPKKKFNYKEWLHRMFNANKTKTHYSALKFQNLWRAYREKNLTNKMIKYKRQANYLLNREDYDGLKRHQNNDLEMEWYHRRGYGN